MKIALIDYGAGNVRSVQFALERLHVKTELVTDPDALRKADRIILPGVGAAGSARKTLQERGLWQAIAELEQPLLAICLGMQLLGNHSAENDTQGLGVVNESVLPFENVPRVPHMGWNQLSQLSGPLFEGIAEGSYVYFVHSYFMPCNRNTVASSTYGAPFSAAINHNNFWACQFHPEKSSATGSLILKNFIERCG